MTGKKMLHAAPVSATDLRVCVTGACRSGRTGADKCAQYLSSGQRIC